MSEYTKGPWTVHEGIDYIVVMATGQGTDDALARVDTVANARLIAAAPETAAERDRLKAILQQLLDEAEMPHAESCAFMRDNIVVAHQEDRPVTGCDCIVSTARAALSRATETKG